MISAVSPAPTKSSVPRNLIGTRAALFHLWRRPESLQVTPSLPQTECAMVSGTVTARFAQGGVAAVRSVPFVTVNSDSSRPEAESVEARNARLSAALMDDIFIF